MSVHIGAKPGEVAETVLLPGDPYRARWAAERFLERPRCIHETRGMLGFSGTYKGIPVTIQGSGMGMPSAAIYTEELVREFGARRLIRVGSCGALTTHVNVHDIVIAMAASTASTMNRLTFGEIAFAPVADWNLLRLAVEQAESCGIHPHVGGILTHDLFYAEEDFPRDRLSAHGVLAVEMETAAIYAVAARLGARALSILTVSDNIATGAALPSRERERGFATMIEIALETVLRDAGQASRSSE